jgi:NAD(P)H dehydrogenase (quinone)
MGEYRRPNIRKHKEEEIMPKVLIIYYSKTRNTEKMAQYVEEGVKSEGIEVILKKVSETSTEDMLNADGIIIGSPTYFGTMTAEIKELMDKSVQHFGKMNGKVGAAFSTSANLGGGNETTVLDILKAFLIHGMIIQGETSGGHYGPVAIGAPDDKCRKECQVLGQKVARLVKKLS